jgi:PAS domain S-box-containing protein
MWATRQFVADRDAGAGGMVGAALATLERRQAQQALRASEARIRQIVETAQEGIWVLDAAGRTTSASPRMAEMLGCSIDELHARSILDFTEDAGWGLAGRNWGTDGQTRSQQQAVHFRRQDGSDLWTIVSTSPVREASGAVVGTFAMIADTTERTRMEEHRLRLATIVESSPDAIIGTTSYGIVTSWNRGAERLFGYTPQEAIGHSINLLHPPDQAGELAILSGRLRRGESIDQYETVRAGKDGHLRDVSLSISPIHDGLGQVIGAATIVRDITDRKRAEAALRATSEQLRTVLDNTPLVLSAVDRHGRCTILAGRALP